MSAEGQTIREALDAICPRANAVDCDLPEHEKARAAHQALDALEARLAEAQGYEHTLTNTALALEARLAEAEQRDAWMRTQLDNCIWEADVLNEGHPSAVGRAHIGNLKDARAALPSESGTP